jgi:FlaA1/EpsC-like NDP-sugar epimerase
MNKIAIFGCSKRGRLSYLHLRKQYQIVVFLDNDRSKHGSRVFGVPVKDPNSFNFEQVDHVYIGSMYIDEIIVQLLALNVPNAKIEYISSDALCHEPMGRPGGGMRWSRMLSGWRSLLYLPFRLLR